MRQSLVLRAFLLPTLLLGGIFTAAPATAAGTLAAYFQARFQAIDGTGPISLSLIASSNPRLQQFSQADLIALRKLQAHFRTATSHAHTYRVEAENGLEFKVYEQSDVRWDDGPNGLRVSSVGYSHVIDLVGDPSSGYQVAKDAFRGVGMDSPDVAVSAATATYSGGRPRGLASRSTTLGSYSRNDALTYVDTWANSQNPNYNNYGDNDCANFMSQGLAMGYEVETATWQPYTLAWINADSHHSFFSSGRGYDTGAVGNVSLGDLIYYNWPASSGIGLNQQWDHVVMVTGTDQYGERYVSGHSPYLAIEPWDTWMAGYLYGYTNAFTAVYDSNSY